ncbi:SDR family oxidoreductase [Spongiimicrobium salis]|uniref:SDR family oxidoreductase n=1 Tax=Spongiimicrobium salis TaxID=1667022 RepID=UPI00374DB2DF
MNKHIGVIGCGWFGLPLAQALVKEGHLVHGSTTSTAKTQELKKHGIFPFVISLSENGISGPIQDFLQSLEVLVVNVPPRLRSGSQEDYTKKMELLLEAIQSSTVRKIIFISSTSVYGDINGKVTELTTPQPETASGKQMLISEKIFRNATGLQTTIVRFGGLIGPHRHPITRLAGRKGLSNGNAPLNLIHLDDCIGIVQRIIAEAYWDDIFNAVYPYHPSKKEYYSAEALKRGLKAPEYGEKSSMVGKCISSEKLINVKNYEFVTSIVR